MQITASERDSIRLACFDIDGTLVPEVDVPGPRTVAALKRLREHGVKLALATGRPWFGARHIAEMLEIDGPSLFFSGGVVLDPRTAEIIAAKTIAPAMLRELRTGALEKGFHCEFYTAEDYFIECENERSVAHRHYLRREPIVEPLDVVADREAIVKVVLLVDRARELAPSLELASAVSGTSAAVGYGGAHPEYAFVNVTSVSASRSAALATMLARVGCGSDQVIAFGDAEGDLHFLESAGIGVAMGTAPAGVSSRARFVTASAGDDGVGKALEALGF